MAITNRGNIVNIFVFLISALPCTFLFWTARKALLTIATPGICVCTHAVYRIQRARIIGHESPTTWASFVREMSVEYYLAARRIRKQMSTSRRRRQRRHIQGDCVVVIIFHFNPV